MPQFLSPTDDDTDSDVCIITRNEIDSESITDIEIIINSSSSSKDNIPVISSKTYKSYFKYYFIFTLAVIYVTTVFVKIIQVVFVNRVEPEQENNRIQNKTV